MLDLCSISHKGGIVLWSRAFTPDAERIAASPASPLNSLVRDALVEGRSSDEKYEKDGYAVSWTFVNELELIFVVCYASVLYTSRTSPKFQVAYQRILQLTYVDELLSAIRTLFVKQFGPFLTAFVASLHAVTSKATVGPVNWNFAEALEGWDSLFDALIKGLEEKAAQVSV